MELTVKTTVVLVNIEHFSVNIQVMSSHKKSENVMSFTKPYFIKCQI